MGTFKNQPLRQNGFTLIEVLIALSLASVVLAILSVGFSSIAKDWARTEKQLEKELDASLGLLQIERALEGAFPHLYKDRKENRSFIFFQGKKNQLSWVTTVSPQRQAGLTAWQLKQGKDKQGLSIQVAPAYADNPSSRLEKAKHIVLFEDYRVTFEYLDIHPRNRLTDDQKEKWLKEWDGKRLQSLPHAVRIILKQPDNTEHLELIASIAANEHRSLKPKRLDLK
jgi:general secretion pathway protein J